MRGLKNNSIETLRDHVDWNAFFDLVRDLGGQLDERKNRFDKSDVLEMALEEYSDGEIKWVDEIGFDHKILHSAEKLEMKTQKGCLYTSKRKHLKPRTKSIKLTNTLAASVDTTMRVTADWLLIVDTQAYSAAIVSYAHAVENANRVPDGWTVQLESEDLEYLFTPDQYIPGPSHKVNLCEQKRNLFRNIVKEYKND